ncbi:hypothetical protein V1264_022991 [Littorina saxatilis]|uniref:Uncharacterized protein n=1 Tax=Littorina saxatilis TaxID=31220 RepID=A0AAN9B723_9CAEN
MPRQEQPSSSSSSDRRADRPAISKAIKRSVKDLYADLALEGKQWETRQGERYDSPTNMQVTGNIRERSKAWYPDASKAELDEIAEKAKGFGCEILEHSKKGENRGMSRHSPDVIRR